MCFTGILSNDVGILQPGVTFQLYGVLCSWYLSVLFSTITLTNQHHHFWSVDSNQLRWKVYVRLHTNSKVMAWVTAGGCEGLISARFGAHEDVVQTTKIAYVSLNSLLNTLILKWTLTLFNQLEYKSDWFWNVPFHKIHFMNTMLGQLCPLSTSSTTSGVVRLRDYFFSLYSYLFMLIIDALYSTHRFLRKSQHLSFWV